MTRASDVPICSLIDFYQCIPDYEDVKHLPSHELDERLRHLRCMQKGYLDGRTSPLFTTYFRGDCGYRREDYRDFVCFESECCPKQCPYNGPPGFSKNDYKLTFESSYGREQCSASTPLPKDSITTGSTLSNKSSKSAISNGDTDTPSKPNRTKRRKNTGLKKTWSKPTGLYFDSSTRGGVSSFQGYECDEVYGASWVDKVQRSLPCSPVHRRSSKNVNTDKQKRSRLLSYLSTPDIRVPEERPSYVFRAQPFPSHIFSNYINERRDEKSNHRAESRRKRAEELQKTSFLPPSMRRRQKANTNTIRSEKTKTYDDCENHHRPESPDRIRCKGQSPYRKVERRLSSNRRRWRTKSVEARDNLASLLRLEASRRKLEAESTAAAEAAEENHERRMRARATRLSPVWHSALSRPTTAEDLMLKAARRREETIERNRRRRTAVAAMRERVRAAPSLMERQSLINTASSLGGYSYRDSGLKSTKPTNRLRRPTTADVWRCYSNSHSGYIRTNNEQTSHTPKRRRSRIIISNKNSFSDDEVQRQHLYNSKSRRKPSFSHQKDLREVFYDPPESEFGLHNRKQGSPTKSQSSVNHSPNYRSPENGHSDDLNHSPNYRSPENGHSDDLTEDEQLLLSSGHPASYIVNAGGRHSRADWSFSESHGDDSQIPHEVCRNGSSELRNGHNYGSPEQKRKELSDKTFSRDEFGSFVCSSRRQCPPFLKSETWPTNSTKGQDHCDRSASLGTYENGRMEAITRRFEDISLKSSSPIHERMTDRNFEDGNNEAWSNQCRSTRSSPQLRRRSVHHNYKAIHDSIPRLDLALQREYFNEENLRPNRRSPKLHLTQNRSTDVNTT